MNDYGLKIIYRMTAGSRVFYEESIVLLKAESFDAAYEKAEAHALGVCSDEYINVYGEPVKTELVDIVDCFQAFDEDNGVQEVYSRTTTNRTGMDEAEWIGVITEDCTAEEMTPLRNRELNESLAREIGGRE